MAQENGITADLDIDGTSYRLRKARITESLSEVPICAIDLTNDDGPLPEPVDLLGKDLVLTFAGHGVRAGDPHIFRGVVVDVSREVKHDGEEVRVIASPKIWRLQKRTDCRIFQDKDVVEIVTEVLEQAGVTDLQKRISGTYGKRLHTTQYRETDLDFVMRLLAEEGIYFLHDFKEKELLVLCDDPKGTGDAVDKEMSYHDVDGEAPPGVVGRVRQSHRVKTDKVFIRDYDFERPRLDLESKVEGTDKGGHALEVYEYPGRFVDAGTGKQYAQVLLDSMQCQREIVEGTTTSLTLAAGLRFTVKDHPYEPLNQEYLLTSVVTEYQHSEGHREFGGGRMIYETHWSGIPTLKGPFRPARRTRMSHISGIQTALTTGPSGQEVYTDKHGRVKVHFPWNRAGEKDQTSSTWMRTSQLPTGGSMLLPRVGWEVVVQCNEGDPDHPLVMARLYNAQKPPPYELPKHKARMAIQTDTTPGGGTSNEIRMDDTKGSEEMFINASKDTSIKVNNNATESVGANETRKIGSNQTIEITNSDHLIIGGNHTIDVGGNQDMHVSTFMVDDTAGDHTLTIGGNRDMKVGGDHKKTVAANSSVSVGSLCTDLVVGKVSEQIGADYNLDVGAVRAAITAGDHSVSAGGNYNEKDGLLKVIVTFGGKSVEVSGSYMQKALGAVLAKVDGDHSESSGATFTEVAAGASIVKADTAVYEAEGLLSLVMGASTITLTPASASIAGVSIKMDGVSDATAALILNN